MPPSAPLEPTSSPIAVDSSYDSSDDGRNGDVTSLTPSITDYPVKWGRRYHRYKEGTYLFPNDEAEASRLDRQHTALLSVHNGRLFFSPLQDPRRILDIGCGTGIWALDLADSGKVPNAKITGTDLSPIQPKDVPENVFWEIADCTEDDWCRPTDSIDLVHARLLIGSVKSFPHFMRTAQKYLKPGTGWLECHELDPRPLSDDGTLPPKWPMSEWIRLMSKGLKSACPTASLYGASELKQQMEDAGYMEVREYVYKVPIGGWPRDPVLKKSGRVFAETIYDGLPGFSYKVLGAEGLDMSRPEIEVFLAEVRKSLVNADVHSYLHLHTVCGRKPSVAELRSMQLAREIRLNPSMMLLNAMGPRRNRPKAP